MRFGKIKKTIMVVKKNGKSSRVIKQIRPREKMGDRLSHGFAHIQLRKTRRKLFFYIVSLPP